ncbi:MAG: transcription elongation factor GreA [Planctomycetota bacterium]|jgi:transcription elongation factor GreA
MSDDVPMTRAGYNRIKAEIERLENEEMPRIAEKIAEARAEGDLKENAEYHAQRENQGLVQAKINSLKAKLSRAHIIETASLPRDQVVFGARVKLKDLKFGDFEEYTLVGAGEENYETGRILSTSPFGAAMLGKKVGEVVEVVAPKGTLRYEVLEIAFDDE